MKRLEAKLSPEILKEVRVFLGAKSVKDMADMLGVSVNTYANWENGKRPIPLMLEKHLIALVKNMEFVETMVFMKNYIMMVLNTAEVAEKMRQFYPFFDLERVMEFPVMDFMFHVFSAVPIDHMQKRLEELAEGKMVVSPFRMRKILEGKNNINLDKK